MYGAVGIIVAITLASGPLVPWVDFTPDGTDSESAPLGSGTATIEVLTSHKNETLDRGEFGAGTYYLRVADARIRVSAVTGRPLLVYKLRIRQLGHTRLTTYALDESCIGNRTVGLEPSTITADEVDRDSYPGELLMIVRDDRGERTLLDRNVTVQVDG